MSRTISSPVIAEDAQNALQDAFMALRLSSPLPLQSLAGSQNIPRLEPEDPSMSRKRLSERTQPPKTAQSSSPIPERRSTLPELWADPNALYTMTCLEGQFVKVLGLNPSRLTIDDFERLYKAKFRELNDEIIGENLEFVDAMQAYERDYYEHQERMRRLKMQQQYQAELREHLQQHQQQSQEHYDPHYFVMHRPGTYIYSSSGSFDSLPVESHQKPPTLLHMDVEYGSARSQNQVHWSPTKLVASEPMHQESSSSRSSSWPSPVQHPPEGYSRPRGSSHVDYSRQVVGDPALVYYSTPAHSSSAGIILGEPRFHSYQILDPASSINSGHTAPQ